MTTATRQVGATTAVALALGFLTTLGPASVDMYLPSLPRMATELGTSYATMQLTLTVFLLSMGGGQLVFGPVIDSYGRRIPRLIAVVVFILASLWASQAGSAGSLIPARVVQGLAASLAIVTATSTVRDVAEGVRATQIFALLMTVQGLGPVVAPAIGGVIGEQLGWRAVFLVLAGLGALVLICSYFMLPESLPDSEREKLNLRSVAKTYADIIRDRRFLLPALSLTSVFSFLFAYIGGSAYAFQEVYNVSPLNFGFLFAGTGLALLLGAMSSAALVRRFRERRLAVAGSGLILLGCLVGFVSAVTGTGIVGIVAGMAIALAGLGIAETTFMSIALSTRSTSIGASAALLGAVPLMFGATMTPIAGYMVERSASIWLLGLLALGLLSTILAVIGNRPAASESASENPAR